MSSATPSRGGSLAWISCRPTRAFPRPALRVGVPRDPAAPGLLHRLQPPARPDEGRRDEARDGRASTGRAWSGSSWGARFPPTASFRRGSATPRGQPPQAGARRGGNLDTETVSRESIEPRRVHPLFFSGCGILRGGLTGFPREGYTSARLGLRCLSTWPPGRTDRGHHRALGADIPMPTRSSTASCTRRRDLSAGTRDIGVDG
jgi:hypothetical protein